MRRTISGAAFSAATGVSLLIACGGAPGDAAGAKAPAASTRTVCATFYADAQLKGATLVSMGPSDSSPTVPATFNDVMSSVAVSPGCTVVAYADGDFGGQEATFTQTTEAVPASINDQMSSYKCTCAKGGT